jgi:predicted dehydrogenase
MSGGRPSIEHAPGRRARSALERRLDRVRSWLLDRVDSFASGGPSAEKPRASGGQTGVGIVGCGFVADFYAANFPLHPDLRIVACTDLDRSRSDAFAARNGGIAHATLGELLADPSVGIVLNLTNPASHFAVTRASLEAGKHVYSEKPLAADAAAAAELAALAYSRGRILASAPCSVLSETAAALRTAVRRGDIGTVRLAYAELDDGPIHRMRPDEWASPAGTPWPWRDEFTVGCTIEHASYPLTWLVAAFGPVERVTAFSTTIVGDKHPDLAGELCGPDFSIAALQFACGLVARLTCSIVAPHDHSLRLIGDDGVLEVDECWHFGAPLTVRRFTELGLRADTYAWLTRRGWTRALFGIAGRKSDLSPRPKLRRRLRRHEMDYALGVAELAAAIREGRPCRLDADLAVHVTEVARAISNARRDGCSVDIQSSCAPFAD